MKETRNFVTENIRFQLTQSYGDRRKPIEPVRTQIIATMKMDADENELLESAERSEWNSAGGGKRVLRKWALGAPGQSDRALALVRAGNRGGAAAPVTCAAVCVELRTPVLPRLS